MASVEQLSYEVVADWEQLPSGMVHRDVSDVAVDADDRVYFLTRRDARVIVYERDGTFVREWGGELLSSGGHGIGVGADGSVWVADQFAHAAYKFTSEGELLLTLGTPGTPADTGYDVGLDTYVERTLSTKGGPPFNNPTDATVAPNGDVYMTDGYGNARVHQFTGDGELIRSFGGPGSGDGEFRIPHAVCVDHKGRLLVADRDNDRIQLFTLDGTYMETWPSQRPCGIAVHDGLIYVSETRWDVGGYSFTRGEIKEVEWARVSVYDEDGRLLTRFGAGEVFPDDLPKPGVITSAHGIAVDSRGDIYVAETTFMSVGRLGLVPEDCHTIQKFQRAG